MKIRSPLLLGGHRVAIHRFTPRNVEYLNCGEWRGNSQNIIVIRTGMEESAEAETLLHEIVEAGNCMHDLGMSHQQISTVAEFLFAVIRVNNLDFRRPKQ